MAAQTDPRIQLAIDDVSVAFDGVPVVRDVSLNLPAGEVLAVLGPSGCGKSTLLRAVAGLELLTSGTIRLGGRSLAGVPTHKRGLALMFQDGQLFGHLDVAANVGYALKLRRVPGRADRVRELLALVGLAGYEDRLPSTLSGGERQRVALARALAGNPEVLLLDEPLSALDAGLRERLAEDLRTILTEAGTTALMVTHDHEEAFTVADQMAVMREGRVVQTGPISEVWRGPVDEWTALFLGYATVLHGEAAGVVRRAARLSAGGDLAIRRSALVVDPGGPLAATVRAASSTPERLRLIVDAAGIGVVDAVAALDSRIAPGDEVRLRVEAARVAAISSPAI